MYQVRDPEFDRVVALKLCLTRGPKAAQLLMDEAKVMAKLSHPNIVTVYEPGRYGDDVFFVMEYVDGPSGREFVKQLPSWERTVDVYIGAGRGLAAAHRARVAHGDFKPSNILLDKHDLPRVADFGLARAVFEHASEDERETYRRRPGTLRYMAPEVLRGGAGDARSDQWSFCVALWETLNTAPPFAARTPEGMLECIERCPPEDMPVESVPRALCRIVCKGLSTNPNERYPSMDALVDELEELRKPLPPKSPTRSSWTPTIVGLMIALVSGLVVLSWVQLHDDGVQHQAQPGFEFPCALGPEDDPVDMDVEVVAVCHEIRQNKIDEAQDRWVAEWDRRRRENDAAVEGLQMTIRDVTSEELAALMEQHRAELEYELARDTLIVARTFIDQAQTVGHSAQSLAGTQASQWWLTRAGDVLGRSDPAVQEVQRRIGR